MGLSALLEDESDIEIVGTAKNGEEAVSESLRLRPDVLIMDLQMPKKDGVEATLEIHRQLPEVKILILTTFGTSDGIAHALANGATGALLKNAENDEVAKAIRTLAAGKMAISPEIAQMLSAEPPVPALTPRQESILPSLVRGLTNRDIARQLGISEDCVREYVNAILQKLGAANRTEAVAIALRRQLLKT